MGAAVRRPARPRPAAHADGEPLPADYDQHTVIAQIAQGVFDDFPPGFYFVVAMTGIILVLAANTAFNGFPVLGSILARTASRRGRSARAATGSPTATASSSWPSWRSS